MKEYTADQKTGKALYKRTKKLYKRYKYGTFIMLLLLLVMVICNIRMLMRAEDMSQVPEIMILVVGEDILFLIAAAVVRAFAISGGREVFMSRLVEKCFLQKRVLSWSMCPMHTKRRHMSISGLRWIIRISVTLSMKKSLGVWHYTVLIQFINTGQEIQ